MSFPGEADPVVAVADRAFVGPQFVNSVDESTAAIQQPAVLTVENVSKLFEWRRGLTVTRVQAVKDATFELRKSTVAALVGQSGSGSGRSTLARMITGIDSPTTGRIVYYGEQGEQEVAKFRGRRLRDYRSHVQMVFQDPYSSLNPAKTLGYVLSRPLVNYHGLKGKALTDRVNELLERRADAVRPVPQPVRVRVVRWTATAGGDRPRARRRSGDHRGRRTDLLGWADQVIVLNEGQVVEQGLALDVIRNPQDDYPRKLLAAIPNPFADEGPHPPPLEKAAAT